MGNAADHIGAEANGFLHQLAAIAVGLDALLGKRDNLQVDQVAALLAHFEHGLERRQVWIGDVHMGAHMLDAMGRQGLDGLFGAGLGVFLGDAGLAFAPAFDPFKQRPAHIPARFAGGEGGVEVDMWLDKGGTTRLPAASRSSGPRGGTAVCGVMLAIRPCSRCRSCRPSRLRRRALMICMGKFLLGKKQSGRQPPDHQRDADVQTVIGIVQR